MNNSEYPFSELLKERALEIERDAINDVINFALGLGLFLMALVGIWG